MIDGTTGQRGERRSGRSNFRFAFGVWISDDGIRIGDVEIIADQGYAKWRVQVVKKHASDIRHAITVGVTQQRNPIAFAGVAA